MMNYYPYRAMNYALGDSLLDIPVESIPEEYRTPVTVVEPVKYDEYFIEAKTKGK